MKKISVAISLSLFLVAARAQDFTVTVPSPPSSCYSSKDDYMKNLDAAREQVKAQTEQKENEMKAQAQAMTQDQKMKIAMQYQNMSPQDIVKMQQQQADMQKLMTEVGTKEADLTNKFNKLESAYDSTLKSKLSPITEQISKLPDGEGTPDWAIAKSKELTAQYNKEYEIVCMQYIVGPAAAFPKWLADYKTYLAQTKIPYLKQAMQAQMAQMGLKPDESIYALNVEKDYLDYCRTVYGKRHQNPLGE